MAEPQERDTRPGPALALGLTLAVVAGAASATLMGLAGWLIVKSAQAGLAGNYTFSWIYPAAGVEALAVVRTAARYGERVTTHEATLQLLARLRARVFASATRMTPVQLRRFRSGDLLDRVQADIDSLDRVVLAVAVPGIVSVIIGAAGVAVLALIRPEFAMVNAAALAIAVAGDVIISLRGRRVGESLARTRAAARARLVEALDGRTELASYGAGELALAEVRHYFNAVDRPRRRLTAREGTGMSLTDLAGTLALAATLASGAGLGSRPLDLAMLAFAALLSLTLFEVAGALAAAGPAAGQARAAWRRLTETSGLDVRAAAEPGQAEPFRDTTWAFGDISVAGLVAGMGERPSLSIGQFALPAGGFTVVSGASGAGKSTLLRVLAGALPPKAGAVRIGGADPHALRYEELIAGVTLVEQDSQLLSGTVEENLRLARPDASAADLADALETAVLSRDLSLSSRIGPGGEGLSGGQRRRLSVAQGYLRRPGLLLLDEPTEGLDRETARALLKNLRSALPDSTIVAAIHDRTSDHLPAPVDVVVRLAAGRVIQSTSATRQRVL
jgi:ATP-binding cassette, subfamily C, bacterial CydC